MSFTPSAAVRNSNGIESSFASEEFNIGAVILPFRRFRQPCVIFRLSTRDQGMRIVLLLHRVTGGSGIEISKQLYSFIDKFQRLHKGLCLFLQLGRFLTKAGDHVAFDSS